MKDFLISLLSGGGISSKRFWAAIITTVLCISYLYCTFKQCEMPEATYGFLSLDAVLLGIEAAITPFKKRKNAQ